MTLDVGFYKDLTASVLPVGAPQAVVWSSKDFTVAIVDASGSVTGRKAGTTEITATTPNGISATCKVTVKDPVIPPTSITATPGILKLQPNGDPVKVTFANLPAGTPQSLRIREMPDELVANAGLTGEMEITITPLATGTTSLKVSTGLDSTVVTTVAITVLE